MIAIPMRRAAAGFLIACAAGASVACDESLQGVDGLAPSGSPRLLAVTPQELLAQFGVQLDTPIRVRVVDAEGRPIRSAVVKYEVLVGVGAFSADSTITNDQGFTEVLFRPLSTGTVIIEARVEGAGSVDRAQFTFLVLSDPTEAAVFEKVGGDGQAAPVGAVLGEPLAVRILNPDLFPVEGHEVTFVLRSAQGAMAGVAADRNGPFTGQVTVATDASGVARAFLRLGTQAGAYVVTASAVVGPAGDQTTATLTFGATATASRVVDRLVPISGQTQNVVVDTLHERGSEEFRGRDPNPMVLQAVDEFGNPVVGAIVSWFVADGGGTLQFLQTVTNSNGLTSNQIFEVTEGSNVVVAFAPGADPIQFSITAEVLQPEEEGEGEGGGGG